MCCCHFRRIFTSVHVSLQNINLLSSWSFLISLFEIYFSFVFKTIQTVRTFNLVTVEITNKTTDHKILSEIASTKGWNNNNVSDNQRVLTGFRPLPVVYALNIKTTNCHFTEYRVYHNVLKLVETFDFIKNEKDVLSGKKKLPMSSRF